MKELGQILFHNKKVSIYDCPDCLTPILADIERIMEEEGIICRKDGFNANPFRNTGDVKGFKNDVFEVHAFDWGDEPIFDFNFKYKDFEVSWYKYLGRGMTMNKKIDLDFIEQMYQDCVKSIVKNY